MIFGLFRRFLGEGGGGILEKILHNLDEVADFSQLNSSMNLNNPTSTSLSNGGLCFYYLTDTVISVRSIFYAK